MFEIFPMDSVFQCNPRNSHEWFYKHWQIPPMAELSQASQ